MPSSLLWCLRITVAGQCLAAARIALAAGSEVNGWLFMVAGLPEDIARLTDQVAAGVLIATAASALFRPIRALLFFDAAWMLAISAAIFTNPGSSMSWLAPLAHGVRYAAPLALALLVTAPGRELSSDSARARLAVWAMLLGAAATFIAHGIEALEHYGRFIDLIIGSAKRWLGWSVSQDLAEQLLTVIGVQDLILAAMLLSRRWRWVAMWMALWGLFTALSRMTAMGGGSWHQTLLRSANAGVPLALFLGWWQLVRTTATKPKP